MFALDPTTVQAWSSVAVAMLTLALVGVTTAYVVLTRSLVRAAQSIEFEAVVLAYWVVGLPATIGRDRAGPFPETIRITNRGVPVWVERAHYDATRAGGRSVGGQVGDAAFIDPPKPPVLLYRSAVLYCSFDEGSWAIADAEQEVAVDITFRRRTGGKLETYTARAQFVIREEPWQDRGDEEEGGAWPPPGD